MGNRARFEELRVSDYYCRVEDLAFRIFNNSGFSVVREYEKNYYVDFIAKISELEYCIEVKASSSLFYRSISSLEDVASRLEQISKQNNWVPVLVVFSVIPEQSKQKLISRFNIVVLDLPNLLSIVKGTELQDELVGILPFAVDNIEPEKPSLELGWVRHTDEASTLLAQLDNCIAGRDCFTVFEDVCTDVLKYIFADDLSLWRNQAQSNDRLYRFDLLCRIKDDVPKTFWRTLESFFHTKYIIFEFKNYSKAVTQSEIYTTERYLYSKALRNVAIIIAKNGFDENSTWAAKGSLRENGKLILLVSIDELKEMVRIKQDKEDPSGLLLSKLDDLLVELEK